MVRYTGHTATSPLANMATTPFPKQQLFVLGTLSLAGLFLRLDSLQATALCRICEPIAFMSIFPYVYYMIKSFKITSNDRDIAVYAGMVTSAFALAEFSTSVLWGRLSDRVGRKPILLMGLAGTGISMLVFGFATSLPVALFGRALGGLLNGWVLFFETNKMHLTNLGNSNIGVLQTTVAEVVTVEAHRRK